MKTTIHTYDELIQFPTFEERLEYLSLKGIVGEETFGFDRYINQMFLHSQEWKNLRRKIIVRDLGRDLGMPGDEYEINGIIIVHHMNPLEVKDIVDMTEYVMNPNYLITTSHQTHNAIHYGFSIRDPFTLIERKPRDTCPWRK